MLSEKSTWYNAKLQLSPIFKAEYLLDIICSEIIPISLVFFSLLVIIHYMTSQHKRTFLILFFFSTCFLLPTLRTKFPHFLCTVCKIVVCSQHSFQFKEFNSQSASLTNSSRSPFKFPQPKHGCFMVFHKLFHGLALFIFFISFRFSQMCLLVVVKYSIWLTLKSFNITYCIITQRVSLIWMYIYKCTKICIYNQM